MRFVVVKNLKRMLPLRVTGAALFFRTTAATSKNRWGFRIYFGPLGKKSEIIIHFDWKDKLCLFYSLLSCSLTAFSLQINIHYGNCASVAYRDNVTYTSLRYQLSHLSRGHCWPHKIVLPSSPGCFEASPIFCFISVSDRSRKSKIPSFS